MLKGREHATLDDALYDTVHYSTDPKTGKPLTVREIATDINVPPSRLQDAADPHRDQPAHMSWIVPLVKRTHNFSLIEFMGRSLGCAVIRLPEATAGSVELVSVIGDVMREVGDVIKVASESLEDDDKVDAREKAILLQQITEAKSALCRAEALVQRLKTDDETTRLAVRR